MPFCLYLQTSLAASGGGQNVGGLLLERQLDPGRLCSGRFQSPPTITLNLGLRWDVFHVFNSASARSNNANYLILKAIGNPYGVLPSNLPDKHDFQPRVGLAWDVGGKGKNIFRVSYGIFDIEQIKNTTYLIDQQSPPQTGIYSTSRPSSVRASA